MGHTVVGTDDKAGKYVFGVEICRFGGVKRVAFDIGEGGRPNHGGVAATACFVSSGNCQVNVYGIAENFFDCIANDFSVIFLQPIASKGVGGADDQTVIFELFGPGSFDPRLKARSAQLYLETFKYLIPQTFEGNVHCLPLPIGIQEIKFIV